MIGYALLSSLSALPPTPYIEIFSNKQLVTFNLALLKLLYIIPFRLLLFGAILISMNETELSSRDELIPFK